MAVVRSALFGTLPGVVHNVGLLPILDLRHSDRRTRRCLHAE